MLATLKDKTNGAEQEKRIYKRFIFSEKARKFFCSRFKSKKRRHGAALECLQRAFEVGINYAVYNKKAKINILKLRYDTELLVTGKKTKKSLAERYTEQKEKNFYQKKISF